MRSRHRQWTILALVGLVVVGGAALLLLDHNRVSESAPGEQRGTPAEPGPTSPPGGGGQTATPVGPGQVGGPVNESVTVAFLADGGMTDDSVAVLQLINDEDADVLVHSGDYDYHDNPDAFSRLLNETLGPDFPVIAVIGNHDREAWSGYRAHFSKRVARADGLRCSGDLGLQSTCSYEGITVVQSSEELCSLTSGDDETYPAACGKYGQYEPEQYARTQLESSASPWKICSWHLPNHRYQVGEKHGVPLSLYDACRRNGADFVVTGHNHAYARTYPMRNFATQEIGTRSPPYTLGDGQSITAVTGASGRSFYETSDTVDASYWETTHTDGDFGVLFCTLYPNGTGSCYFKTTAGEVIDGPFEVRT